MSILKIKKAIERHLNTLTPAVPIAFEGVSFTPPSTLYQACQIQIDDPDDPVYGRGYHRERFRLNVFIVGPTNKGTAEVIARAELVRERFKKGTFLLEDGIRIHVLETPRIAGCATAQDRVVCPVLIPIVAEVVS